MKRPPPAGSLRDGGLLAVPPLAQVAAQFGRTSERLAAWDHDFQGRRAGRLRAMVHHQVIAAARRFSASPWPRSTGGRPLLRRSTLTTPLVVTGHQPELFHPGVWVKNFATAAIGQGPRRPGAEPDRR